MFITQISIFLENTVGSAADTLKLLSDASIDIRALSIADTSEYGIMRLIVNDSEKAKSVLDSHGIMVKHNHVLAIPLIDKPGSLAYILALLKDNGVSVEYMYAFVGKNREEAIVVTRTDNQEKAAEILVKNGITPITELF